MINSIEDIKKFINEKNFKKIFILCGKKSFLNSGAEPIFKEISNLKKIKLFYKNSELPILEELIEIIKDIRNFGPDLILAIGGGTIMDYAKIANVVDIRPDLAKLIENYSYPFKKKYSHLAAIPTTAGSGAEVTSNAVIYVNGIKHSFESDLLIPDYAIVDPSLTENLPKHVVATTAMDALCQSVESFWSVKSTEESRSFAYSSIKLILENVINAYNGDVNAKAKMSEAAFLSGKAINISYTTAAHSLSYPLTTFYGVSHGHAVALTLGSFFVINSNLKDYTINDPRGSDFLESIMNDIFSLFNVKDGTECKIKFRDILIHIGLEIDLFKIGINTQSDINKIVDNVNLDRLNNNPIKLNRNDLMKIFTDLMNDKL